MSCYRFQMSQILHFEIILVELLAGLAFVNLVSEAIYGVTQVPFFFFFEI